MSDSPMRQPAMGGSVVLEQLAERAPPNVIPRQSSMLSKSDVGERIARAVGSDGEKSRLLTVALMFDVLWVFALVHAAIEGWQIDWSYAWPLAGVCAALTIWGWRRYVATEARRLAIEQAALAWPAHQPFPVEGYREWLASDRPLLDIHSRAPFDALLFERAVRGIDAAITVERIGERIARLAIPPLVATRGRKLERGTVKYGNVPLLRRVFDELVLPLHADTGVERVELGGLVEERPVPPMVGRG